MPERPQPTRREPPRAHPARPPEPAARPPHLAGEVARARTPPVEIIPQELGRALLNLLNNALHAVGEQHKKGLAGYVPTVRVSTHRKDAHVEIRIQDNGTGIPAAVRERIFEPFFTTKPPGEGIGLGLSLTHGIILKRHAGTLEFESTEDKGTTFVITLPIIPSNTPVAGGATGERTA
ncbi:sensor histidine kinase [Cystobacter fuscus]